MARELIALLLLAALFNLSSAVGTEDSGEQGELIFAQLLWRHGDRTPTSFPPHDPNDRASLWPVGGGQLTNIGKKQHYLTGQWLRQRYVGFLPDVYSAEDIYVRSTDVSRTIESALANLAGLYPPSGAQIWNPQLLWQPIPVHTVPSSLDYIIAVNTPNCPRFDKLYEAVGNTASIQQIVQQHQSIMDYFEQNSGYPKTNSSIRVVFEMADVRDTLMVEAIYNMTPLAWTKEIYPNVEVDELSMIPSILPSYTTELAQIRAGYFLQEVLDRAASKVNGTLIPDRKLWVYSAHDITISTVLYGMGMWDNAFVQYAAVLLFELFQKQNGTAYLGISYRRHYNDLKAERLLIPGCGFECELSKVSKIYADILPTVDYETLCNQMPTS